MVYEHLELYRLTEWIVFGEYILVRNRLSLPSTEYMEPSRSCWNSVNGMLIEIEFDVPCAKSWTRQREYV